MHAKAGVPWIGRSTGISGRNSLFQAQGWAAASIEPGLRPADFRPTEALRLDQEHAAVRAVDPASQTALTLLLLPLEALQNTEKMSTPPIGEIVTGYRGENNIAQIEPSGRICNAFIFVTRGGQG